MKISVVGAGYVGLSLAVLLCRCHEVIAVDIDPMKVEKINSYESPMNDTEIKQYLSQEAKNLHATTDINEVQESEYIIVATPTNYDLESHSFNTESVESVIKQLECICPEATVVIKSTVPIGFTERFCHDNSLHNVLFSPEFLREGKALYDNLHPSRIIVGVPKEFNQKGKEECFADILLKCSEEDHVERMIIGSTEAESVKLFSNTYLAMRVAFFNELDSFAESNGLDPRDIIKGVSMDPRIGDWYNNPSFGYGGYCLPKDTKQLLADYGGIPHSLVSAIVESNNQHKAFIASNIMYKAGEGKTIGIYRLIMKSDSDNFRESSIIDIMDRLRVMGADIIIYEPLISGEYDEFRVIDDLDEFIRGSDLIVANRFSDELKGCKEKVYSRDLFGKD